MPKKADNNEIGLSELSALLLAEIRDGILSSQSAQETQLREYANASRLTDNEFLKKYVSDDDIDIYLAKLFPVSPGEPPRIAINSPFQLHKGGTDDPPIKEKLNLTFEKADIKFLRRTTKGKLTASAVQKIRNKARLLVAKEKQEEIRALVRMGPIRVIVDSGKLNIKFVLKTLTESEAKKSAIAKLLITPWRALPTESQWNLSNPLKDVRIFARLADDRAPQIMKTKVDFLGELEITFKTVT